MSLDPESGQATPSAAKPGQPSRTARPSLGAMATVSLLTSNQPGAIAVLELVGEVGPLLERLAVEAGKSPRWIIGRCRLLSIGAIDEVVAVHLDPRRALIMPHAGSWIVQRVIQHLAERGVALASPTLLTPREVYPEAADDLEALMLQALARCESSLGIDLLLDQPRRWRALGMSGRSLTPEDHARSARLSRLLEPPRIALVGPPNVGKSTLTNLLAGREVAITAEGPGTTRDAVTCGLDLAGLPVVWHDTPGLRETDDPLEQAAVALACPLIARSDLLLAISDAVHDWPNLPAERPNADLRIGSRCDLGERSDADLLVSAATGRGVADLVAIVRERLVPRADLEHPGPWIFDRRLLEA